MLVQFSTGAPAPVIAAAATAPQPAETKAAPKTPARPPQVSPNFKLVIELDKSSQRFVQTLFDQTDNEIIRRYPNATQLAFSKGVNAYEQAIRNSLSAIIQG